MIKGFYHSIDTFGAVDGRGLRYVLFLAGCKLGCIFCHNPDTWEQGHNTISVDDVIEDIKRYRRFYDASNGGLTVSGGEPLMQADFVAELFKRCRHEKIHTTLDTSGYASPDDLKKVLAYSDAVLFSIKAVNELKHKKLTGKKNDVILSNLCLAASVSTVTIRYVVIPGINNRHDDILALGSLINNLPSALSVELLPYHTLGRTKWDALEKDYLLHEVPAASEQDIEQVRLWLKEQNINVC